MKKAAAIALGVIISLAIIVGLSFAITGGLLTGTRASNAAPRDVVVNNIQDTSVTVQWTTDEPSQSQIEYGLTPSDLTLFDPETADVATHSKELSLLVPNTTYYFHIRTGDTIYDNNGVPWTFITKAQGEGNGAGSGVIKRGGGLDGATSLPEGAVTQPTSGGESSQIAVPTGGCTATTCEDIRSQMGLEGSCSMKDLAKAGCL